MQWLRDLMALDNVDVLITGLLGIVGIVSTYAVAAASRRHERELEQTRQVHATAERQRAERRDLYLQLLEATEELPGVIDTLAMFEEGVLQPHGPQHRSNLEEGLIERVGELIRLRHRVRFEASGSVERAVDNVSEAMVPTDVAPEGQPLDLRYRYDRGLADQAIDAVHDLRAAIRRDQALDVSDADK